MPDINIQWIVPPAVLFSPLNWLPWKKIISIGRKSISHRYLPAIYFQPLKSGAFADMIVTWCLFCHEDHARCRQITRLNFNATLESFHSQNILILLFPSQCRLPITLNMLITFPLTTIMTIQIMVMQITVITTHTQVIMTQVTITKRN